MAYINFSRSNSFVSYFGNLSRFIHVEHVGNQTSLPPSPPWWWLWLSCKQICWMHGTGSRAWKPRSGCLEHNVINLRNVSCCLGVIFSTTSHNHLTIGCDGWYPPPEYCITNRIPFTNAALMLLVLPPPPLTPLLIHAQYSRQWWCRWRRSSCSDLFTVMHPPLSPSAYAHSAQHFNVWSSKIATHSQNGARSFSSLMGCISRCGLVSSAEKKVQ